jgi:uncharacterized metal-binding protein YceD (DUF177 family)
MSDNAKPEFSRAVPLSEIGAGAVSRMIEANADEMKELAKRFDLVSVERLTATLNLNREGSVFVAQGQFSAAVTQTCVASGVPVSAEVNEPVFVRFVAESEHAAEAEVELDAKDCDTMFHDGRVIDLGEAVAQSLALALDPFPRSPDAEAVLKAAGVKGEDEAGPFGALAGLRDKLGRR